jgi:hypothetical protein
VLLCAVYTITKLLHEVADFVHELVKVVIKIQKTGSKIGMWRSMCVYSYRKLKEEV